MSISKSSTLALCENLSAILRIGEILKILCISIPDWRTISTRTSRGRSQKSIPLMPVERIFDSSVILSIGYCIGRFTQIRFSKLSALLLCHRLPRKADKKVEQLVCWVLYIYRLGLAKPLRKSLGPWNAHSAARRHTAERPLCFVTDLRKISRVYRSVCTVSQLLLSEVVCAKVRTEQLRWSCPRLQKSPTPRQEEHRILVPFRTFLCLDKQSKWIWRLQRVSNRFCTCFFSSLVFWLQIFSDHRLWFDQTYVSGPCIPPRSSRT